MKKRASKAAGKYWKLWSFNEMENTGGEPDVIGHDIKTREHIFYDCSAEHQGASKGLLRPRSVEVREKNISQKITLLLW